MAYKYEKQLVNMFLSTRKKELGLGAIVHYIYNENSTLFGSDLDYNKLYTSVRGYLVRQSSSPVGLFENKRRGYFSLHKRARRLCVEMPDFWEKST
jgi:hypothetical protein